MKNAKKGKKSDKDTLDFKRMSIVPIQSVDNCYDCDCGDGEDDGGGCDCVSCDNDD